MRARLSAALVAAVCVGAGAGCGSATPADKLFLDQGSNAIPGQYVVALHDDTPKDSVAAIAEELTKRHGGRVGLTYTDAVLGFSVRGLDPAGAVAMSRDARVEFVEQDGYGFNATVSTQQDPARQLDRVDQRAYPLSCTYVSEPSGRGVDVYVLDSGIFPAHEDFEGRAKVAFDATGADPSDPAYGIDCDKMGHGTAVASLIGGVRFGVAKKANLLAVRVTSGLSPSGQCNVNAVSFFTAGVDFVMKDVRKKRKTSFRPAVVNMSIGSDDPGAKASRMFVKAVKKLHGFGVLSVAASAENETNSCFEVPANIPEVLTVGGIDSVSPSDRRVNGGGPCTDIYAPTGSRAASNFDPTTVNPSFPGSSGAAPFVAGAAALYLEAHPKAAPKEVTKAILTNATPGVVVDNRGVPIDDGSGNKLVYTRFDRDPRPVVTPSDPIDFTTGQGENPAPVTLAVTPDSGDDVEITVVPGNACWLTVSPRSVQGNKACLEAFPAGAAPPGSVQVGIDITQPGCQLAPGSYGPVPITIAGTNGSSTQIPVTLTVTEAGSGCLHCTPDDLSPCIQSGLGECIFADGEYCCGGI